MMKYREATSLEKRVQYYEEQVRWCAENGHGELYDSRLQSARADIVMRESGKRQREAERAQRAAQWVKGCAERRLALRLDVAVPALVTVTPLSWSHEQVLRRQWRATYGPCVVCGEAIEKNEVLHLEHLIPRCRGGPHALENVGPSHDVCNLRKNTLTLYEYFFA